MCDSSRRYRGRAWGCLRREIKPWNLRAIFTRVTCNCAQLFRTNPVQTFSRRNRSTAPGVHSPTEGDSCYEKVDFGSYRRFYAAPCGCKRTGADYRSRRAPGSHCGAPRPASGTRLWSTITGASEAETGRGNTIVVSPDGSTVFAGGYTLPDGPLGDVGPENWRLVAYDARTGDVRWNRRRAITYLTHMVVTADGSLLLVNGSSDGGRGNLSAISTSTGQVVVQ